MIDFMSAVKNVLEEQGKSIDCLFTDEIISKDTFYKYKQRNPNLQTLIKISNYLKVSIDYLFELTDENNFVQYSIDQSDFYKRLIDIIKKNNLSNRQFCKELNYQKDNINRYKRGVQPSVRTLIEMANFFGCSIDDFLTKENEK